MRPSPLKPLVFFISIALTTNALAIASTPTFHITADTELTLANSSNKDITLDGDFNVSLLNPGALTIKDFTAPSDKGSLTIANATLNTDNISGNINTYFGTLNMNNATLNFSDKLFVNNLNADEAIINGTRSESRIKTIIKNHSNINLNIFNAYNPLINDSTIQVTSTVHEPAILRFHQNGTIENSTLISENLIDFTDNTSSYNIDHTHITAKDIKILASLNLTNSDITSTNLQVLKTKIGKADDTKASILKADDLSIGTHLKVIEPWNINPSSIITNTLNLYGKLDLGQNSIMTIGSDSDTWLKDSINKLGGLNTSNISSAIGLKKTLTLESVNPAYIPGIYIGSNDFTTVAAKDNNITLAAKSLLVIDTSILNSDGSNSAITMKTGTLDIAPNAKLRLTNVADSAISHKYTIFNVNTVNSTFLNSNISTDNILFTPIINTAAAANKVQIIFKQQQSSAAVFKDMDSGIAHKLDVLTENHMTNKDSGNFAERFINRALDPGKLTTKTLQTTTIEGAARTTFTGAVPLSGMGSSKAAALTTSARTSISSTGSSFKVASLNQSGINTGDAQNYGLGIWAMPMYEHQYAAGFKCGNFKTGYSTYLAGLTSGIDYSTENTIIGISFNLGDGSSTSNGDFNTTLNDFNFWGVGVYGRYLIDNLNLSFDLNYTKTDNKLEQILPAAMAMDNLKGDVGANTWAGGIKAEYSVKTDYLNIISHIGARISYLDTKGYVLKSAGNPVFNLNAMDATIYSFPFGMTFNQTFTFENNYTITPSIDFTITPATGDLEAKQQFQIPGTAGQLAVKSNILDKVAREVNFGVDIEHNDLSFALNYNIQSSQHTLNQGLFANIRYEF